MSQRNSFRACAHCSPVRVSGMGGRREWFKQKGHLWSQARQIALEHDEVADEGGPAGPHHGCIHNEMPMQTAAITSKTDTVERALIFGGLVELFCRVRSRQLAAIADVSLDAGRGFHPRLCDLEHEVAVAGVVGLVRPAQAIQCEQAHILSGDQTSAPLVALRGGSATGLSVTDATDGPLPVMSVNLSRSVRFRTYDKRTTLNR